MADPTAVVPYYHDPFEVLHTFENILNESHGPEVPNPGPSSITQSTDNEIVGAGHPLIDPCVWEICNNQTVDNLQAGHSSIHDGINGLETENCNPQSPNIGNPNQLSVWPVPPAPYNCSFCQVLRQIIHTNGVETMKLEIHGRLGMICHGILERHSVDMTSQNKDYQMFDFRKESIYGVKQFLVQYCKERKQTGGYTMLQDPLLTFYEALCVGLDWDFNVDIDGIIQGSPIDLGENEINRSEAMNQPEVSHQQVENNAVRPTKRSLAAQREITNNLTLKDLIPYFHLPVCTAAEELQVCSTVIKKICRRNGLSRWPYRKIKSIEKEIEDRSKSLTAADAEERARAQADIQRLQQQLTNFYSQFSD